MTDRAMPSSSSGPNGLAAAIELARGGVERDGARGRGAPGRRRRHAGAHPSRLSPRRLLGRVPGGGRFAGVRALAARRSTGCAGSTRATATRTRCPRAAPPCCPATSARRRPRSTRCIPATARRGRRSPVPTSSTSGACARADARRLPARARAPLRMLAVHGLSGTLDVAKLLLMPASALAGRLFEHGGSRAWLYGSAMHGDVPPDGAGSAIAATHLNVMGHAVGWPSPEGRRGPPRGRAHGLPGGARRPNPSTGAPRHARPLRPRAGPPASEVRPSSSICPPGPSWPTSRRPGCSGSRVTRFDGRYARHLRAFRAGPATLKVDWALGGPIPWAAPEARGAGTVHVGGDEDEVLDALASHGGGLHERPFLLLGQQSVADPSRAPAGRHTAWAYTHGPHDADWAGRGGTARGAHGGAGRALRARVPRPDPRPPRPVARRPRAPEREPGRRRRRRRLLRPRPGRLPPGPGPLALPHAPPRALPRQRLGVPRRRGTRRPGPRGGADRAAANGGCGAPERRYGQRRDATRGSHA